MTEKQICENIMSGIDKIVKHIPGTWKNIKSLNIKAEDTISLPIYNSIPVLVDDVKNEDEKEKKELISTIST